MLEIVAHRKMSFFHELFPIIEADGPLKRMLNVVQYYFTTTRCETIEKKPYNPVIGETHFCWMKHDEEGDYTEFMSEQVSHHPPVSAYVLENKMRGLRYSGNLLFKVSFGTNYVTCTTSGFGRIYYTKMDEVYEISKCIPDMIIKNTIWGKKYIIWIGKVEFACPETGYYAELEFSEGKNKNNVVTGFVKHGDNDDDDDIIYNIQGVCGGALYFYPPGDEEDLELLLDVSNSLEQEICYMREDQLTELSTLNVWRNVNESIVLNNMREADAEKIKVESEQRKRISLKKEEGTIDEAEYFEKK